MSEGTFLLWHTTPLFQVPYLLQTGAIFSAARLKQENHPISPRPSAIRRKVKLGLGDYVHLSAVSRTPLLRDKQTKGYPHVLFGFDRAATLDLPGVGLLKFNTKRWAHRDDFVPVTDTEEQGNLWKEYAAGKYPSLEVLVPKQLPLVPYAAGLHVARTEDAARLRELILVLGLVAPPICVSPELFPLADVPVDDRAATEYFVACVEAGKVLPPPRLVFD